jgi:hypothetical protein
LTYCEAELNRFFRTRNQPEEEVFHVDQVGCRLDAGQAKAKPRKIQIGNGHDSKQLEE